MIRPGVAVKYFGEVFSTSGYGTAARAYIHALHAAGVRVTVTGAGRPPHDFRDALIDSLIAPDADVEFTILHAIPLFWPRWAYTTPNVVAVTVWEADPIPSIWQRALNRAIDVWVPCEFNVNVFGKALRTAPFRLAYALPTWDESAPVDRAALPGVGANDFLFYSIFDWQYRKNASGMMEAFLRAFPDECDAVLLLKTIARAAGEARRLLEQLRAQTQSQGRVILLCEPLDEGHIRALHERGDCYVSLHRGEGWGYPLFEAAARGTPTVASAQGGPLDFLDPRRHRLVPCRDIAVQEPYFLFTREMHWGEPDVAAASKALRWVYEHRDAARADAQAAASLLRKRYSYDASARPRARDFLSCGRQSRRLHERWSQRPRSSWLRHWQYRDGNTAVSRACAQRLCGRSPP